MMHDASAGLFCSGFEYIYETLFGWLKLPDPEVSNDIGKEILKRNG